MEVLNTFFNIVFDGHFRYVSGVLSIFFRGREFHQTASRGVFYCYESLGGELTERCSAVIYLAFFGKQARIHFQNHSTTHAHSEADIPPMPSLMDLSTEIESEPQTVSNVRNYASRADFVHVANDYRLSTHVVREPHKNYKYTNNNKPPNSYGIRTYYCKEDRCPAKALEQRINGVPMLTFKGTHNHAEPKELVLVKFNPRIIINELKNEKFTLNVTKEPRLRGIKKNSPEECKYEMICNGYRYTVVPKSLKTKPNEDGVKTLQ